MIAAEETDYAENADFFQSVFRVFRVLRFVSGN